jgi:hypothetical protein
MDSTIKVNRWITIRPTEKRKLMARMLRTLLALSVAGFSFGLSGVLWGIGLPLGAIFFGLFLIFKVMDKESTLFDSEQRVRLAMAQHQRAAVPGQVAIAMRPAREMPAQAVAAQVY